MGQVVDTVLWTGARSGQGRRALVWNVAPVHWTEGLLVQTYNGTESWGRHGVVHIHCLFWFPQLYTIHPGFKTLVQETPSNICKMVYIARN